VVRDISAVPLPGSVPYKDHVLSLHLIEIECRDAPLRNSQAVIYLQSMRDNTWTPAARLRQGDSIEVRVRPWSDVASHYEGINRTELEDPELQLQEPCWGERFLSIQE
jgi:alginate O-acetyltransferase complex protein AlgJ